MKWLLFLTPWLMACTSSTYWFDHSLAKEEFKLCFIGDVGTATRIQEYVAGKLREEKCDSLHFLGDLIYPDGIKSVDDPLLQSHFLNFYRDLGIPLTLVLGNHDYRGRSGAWLDAAKKYPELTFPHRYYVINFGGVCLVHLDTNLNRLPFHWHQAVAQSWWLTGIRPRLKKECQSTLALTHHPFKNRGHVHGDAKALTKYFLKSQVIGEFDYLLSGHEHLLSDEGEVEGTRLLISGAGGKPHRTERPGYIVLQGKREGSRIVFTTIMRQFNREEL